MLTELSRMMLVRASDTIIGNVRSWLLRGLLPRVCKLRSRRVEAHLGMIGRRERARTKLLLLTTVDGEGHPE